MDAKILIESFAEFARSKNVDRPTMIRILEDVFRAMIRKKFESDENFDVTINADKGDLEIFRIREIVDDNSEDIWDFDKISLSDAQKIEPDFEVGEEVYEKIELEEFGRRAVQMARQTLIQRIKDLEKDLLFSKYEEQVGEIISAEVYQILGREILLIDSEGNELILPKGEQISKDRFRKGDSVKSIVHRVDMINGNPKVILSRTSPVFLERLFENEVPEIHDGTVLITNCVREAGDRAKVAVRSLDPDVDPVGACVGLKGSRVQAIIRELQKENIDIARYDEDPAVFIAHALNPAKVIRVNIMSEEERRVEVIVSDDQLSVAIGKRGQNVRLAAKLTGWNIDVRSHADQQRAAAEETVIETAPLSAPEDIS